MERVTRRPFPTALGPYGLFQRLRGKGRHAVLLESRDGPRRMARYSILATDPAERFDDREGANPFPLLREVLAQHRTQAHDGPLPCGIVGAIGYGTAAHLGVKGMEARAPTYALGLYLDAVVFDRERDVVEYVSAGEDRSQAYAQDAEKDQRGAAPFEIGAVTSNVDVDAFSGLVDDVKRRIHDGETYQTVISRRFDARTTGDAIALYRDLQRANPSPYMYFLDFDDVRIVGSSPEMLVRVEDGNIESFPIAGTRAVLDDPDLDAAARQELLADPKENAEHIMLVDLARNDVGRVARRGSVEVPTFRRVQSFANVHHMVSRVTGRLRDDADGIDAFESVFPAGTVTGAPKLRAMQIIDELEKEPRGFYAGAVGYFGLSGNVDSAINIRSLTSTEQGRMSVQAGAGIVQDSTARREWEETAHKASAILGAARVRP